MKILATILIVICFGSIAPMQVHAACDTNMKFLVVDDSLTMRRIVRISLNQLGFSNVVDARDGVEAFQRLKSENYDFVITDLNIQNMNGLELLRNIRSNDLLKNIPVLMMTAETEKENVIAAGRAGASGYIVKPFTAATLQEKISAICPK